MQWQFAMVLYMNLNSKESNLIDIRSKIRGNKLLIFMKLKNILKTTGALHILLGLLIISLLIFSVETIAGDASSETLLLVRGTADVVAACNLGIEIGRAHV